MDVRQAQVESGSVHEKVTDIDHSGRQEVCANQVNASGRRRRRWGCNLLLGMEGS